jgi:hypothetical protein
MYAARPLDSSGNKDKLDQMEMGYVGVGIVCAN